MGNCIVFFSVFSLLFLLLPLSFPLPLTVDLTGSGLSLVDVIEGGVARQLRGAGVLNVAARKRVFDAFPGLPLSERNI